jgi:hypothetical protein
MTLLMREFNTLGLGLVRFGWLLFFFFLNKFIYIIIFNF